MQRGAAEANAESTDGARMAQARRIGEAVGTLAAALNRCMTEDDVRRIVREELRNLANPVLSQGTEPTTTTERKS